MDTKTVISLIFVILILVVGLGIMISKYLAMKKKNQELTFNEFISKYGTNVLALLKDAYNVIQDNHYENEDEMIEALVNLSCDIIKDQFNKYDISSDYIELLSDDMIRSILTKLAIEAKDQIIDIVVNRKENNSVDDLELEDIHDVEEEPEVIEEVPIEEAQEMVNLQNIIIDNAKNNSNPFDQAEESNSSIDSEEV